LTRLPGSGIIRTIRIHTARRQESEGDVAAAQTIASKLRDEHPAGLTIWRLQTDVCLAANDFDGCARTDRAKALLCAHPCR
jgi:hypothetical protein